MQRIKVTMISNDGAGRVGAYIIETGSGHYVPMIGNSSQAPDGSIYGTVVKLELMMDVPNEQTDGYKP